MAGEKKFAGASILIGATTIGRVTTFTRRSEVREDEATGVESTEGTAPNKINRGVFVPVTLDEIITIGGVLLQTDTGQAAAITAARTGAEVTITATYQDNTTYTFTGFFRNFEEQGNVNQVMRFTSEFRVNSVGGGT